MKITDLKSYSVAAPATDPILKQSILQQPKQEDRSFGDKAKDFTAGAVYSISAPGRTIQNYLSKGVDKVFGTQGFGEATKEGFEKSTGADVDTTSGKVGQFAGDVALFAVPGSQATKATQGASLLTKSLVQGATAAGTQAAKTGEIGKDEAAAFVFGSASVPLGNAFEAAAKNLSTKFPEWLVKPLLKQAKDAKVAGKDIAPFLVSSGRVGSVDSLISQSQNAIDDVAKKVGESLAKSSASGVSVTRGQIIDQVVNKVNQAGGAIDADDVLGIVNNLAPQAKGLLKKDSLTLLEANQLRSLIDKTLGDKAFVASQLPFNKDVLRSFTNTLRETVKQNGDDSIRSLFDDWSKNITLRDALVDRASVAGGANSVGIYDLITGAGAYGFTGDPITALGAAGTRRLLESGVFKTSAAQVFRNTDKVSQALLKYSPANRSVILSFMDDMTSQGDDSSTLNTQ